QHHPSTATSPLSLHDALPICPVLCQTGGNRAQGNRQGCHRSGGIHGGRHMDHHPESAHPGIHAGSHLRHHRHGHHARRFNCHRRRHRSGRTRQPRIHGRFHTEPERCHSDCNHSNTDYRLHHTDCRRLLLQNCG